VFATLFNDALAGVEVDEVQFLFIDPAHNDILHFYVAMHEIHLMQILY
jgi:hypothetical protein